MCSEVPEERPVPGEVRVKGETPSVDPTLELELGTAVNLLTVPHAESHPFVTLWKSLQHKYDQSIIRRSARLFQGDIIPMR